MYELSCLSEKEKGKSSGKGRFLVRSSRLPLSDRRQQLRELRERTECYAFGRKGHWTHDYKCTMSPFSLFPKNPDTRCSPPLNCSTCLSALVCTNIPFHTVENENCVQQDSLTEQCVLSFHHKHKHNVSCFHRFENEYISRVQHCANVEYVRLAF